MGTFNTNERIQSVVKELKIYIKKQGYEHIKIYNNGGVEFGKRDLNHNTLENV